MNHPARLGGRHGEARLPALPLRHHGQFMLGSDYVRPRTINKVLKSCWRAKGIAASAWREECVPFGFSNFQNLVSQIRGFHGPRQRQPLPLDLIP